MADQPIRNANDWSELAGLKQFQVDCLSFAVLRPLFLQESYSVAVLRFFRQQAGLHFMSGLCLGHSNSFITIYIKTNVYVFNDFPETVNWSHTWSLFQISEKPFSNRHGTHSALCENSREEQGGGFVDYHRNSYLRVVYFLNVQPSGFMGTLLWLKHP